MNALEQFYFEYGPFAVTLSKEKKPWRDLTIIHHLLQLIHTTRRRLTELGYSRSRKMARTDPNSFRKQIKHFQVARNLKSTAKLDLNTMSNIITNLKTRKNFEVSNLMNKIGKEFEDLSNLVVGRNENFITSDFSLSLLLKTVFEEKNAYLTPIKENSYIDKRESDIPHIFVEKSASSGGSDAYSRDSYIETSDDELKSIGKSFSPSLKSEIENIQHPSHQTSIQSLDFKGSNESLYKNESFLSDEEETKPWHSLSDLTIFESPLALNRRRSVDTSSLSSIPNFKTKTLIPRPELEIANEELLLLLKDVRLDNVVEDYEKNFQRLDKTILMKQSEIDILTDILSKLKAQSINLDSEIQERIKENRNVHYHLKTLQEQCRELKKAFKDIGDKF